MNMYSHQSIHQDYKQTLTHNSEDKRFLRFLSSQLALLEAFDEMEDSLTESSKWFTQHSTSCICFCKAICADKIASNGAFTDLDVSSSDDSLSGARCAGRVLPRCVPLER